MAQLTEKVRARSRSLRINMTDAERRLWSRLRREQLGWRFRRQHPVDPWILDFACIEAMLAIELDGGQHADSARDRRRDADLAQRGWRMLRFWNNDALRDTDAIVGLILAALGPHPNPPPAKPGEGAPTATPVESAGPAVARDETR